MSVEICPVCGGKGLVPNGFYLAVGTSYYSTTNISPETCRSCGGKGYIETFDTLGIGTYETTYPTHMNDCCIDGSCSYTLNIGDTIYVPYEVVKDIVKEQYGVDISKYDYIQCKIWALGVEKNDELKVYLFKGTQYSCSIPGKDICRVVSEDDKICYYDNENYQIGDVVYQLCHDPELVKCDVKITSINETIANIANIVTYDVQLRDGDMAYGLGKDDIYKYPDLIEKYMNIETKTLSSDDTHSTGQKSIVSNGELDELQRQIRKLDSRLKKLEELANTTSLHELTAKTLSIPEKCCNNCKHFEEGMMYMSNPPKFKCLLHQTWYDWSEMNSKSCPDYEENGR